MILHRSSAQSIAAKVVYEGPVSAPIAEGQQIGLLRVSMEGGDAREFPLFAGKAVKAIGPFGRMALAVKTLIGGAPTEGGDASAPQ
jgi:D-alanyl-D-alanine carboxypeptidase (penicillin-binding protein 5/6)